MRSTAPVSGARRATWMPAGRRARWPVAVPVVSFASNDYLGLTQHPAVDRGCARRARPLGRGFGFGAPHRRVAPRSHRSRTRARRMEGRGSRRALPHRLRRQPRRAHDRRRTGHARMLRRAEPRVDHRRLPVEPRRRRDLPPRRPRPPRHAAARRAATGARVVVSDTVFSMDGDTADVDALHRRSRASTMPCSSSTKRTRSSGPPPRSGPTTTCCASERSPRRSARSAASSPGPRAISSCRRTGPALTSSRPRRLRPTPRPRTLPSTSSAAPRATPCVARLRALVDRMRPGHPSPILPFVCGTEDRALSAAAALLELGLYVPAIRPPTVAPGTVAVARHAVGRAHRRTRRPARTRARAACSARYPRRDHLSSRERAPRSARRGSRPRSPRVCATRRRAPTSRCSRSPRATTTPTRDVLGARDRRGTRRRLPASPLAPGCDGATDGGRRSRTPGVHDRGTRGGGPDRAPTLLFVEGAGGLRSPLADDGDSLSLIDALRPDAGRARRRRGPRHDQPRAPRAPTRSPRHDTVVYLNRFDERDELHRAQSRLAA